MRKDLRKDLREYLISSVLPLLYSRIKSNIKKMRGWIGISLILKEWDEIISIVLNGVIKILTDKITEYVLNNLKIKYLSIRDASILTGISQYTLRMYIKQGKLKAIKHKRWFISVSELINFMEGKNDV